MKPQVLALQQPVTMTACLLVSEHIILSIWQAWHVRYKNLGSIQDNMILLIKSFIAPNLGDKLI